MRLRGPRAPVGDSMLAAVEELRANNKRLRRQVLSLMDQISQAEAHASDLASELAKCRAGATPKDGTQ